MSLGQRKDLSAECLWGGLAALLLLFFVKAVVSIDPTNDLTVYLSAAQAIIQGEDPYTKSSVTHYEGVGDVSWRYLYPPLLAIILSVFERIGEGGVLYFWSVCSTGALVATALFIRRQFNLAPVMILLVTGGLALWPVMLDGLERGQINSWILTLMIIWFTGAKEGWYRVAGMAVGVGIHLKLSPVIWCLPFFRRGTKSFWVTLGATILFVGLGTLIISGSGVWLDYIRQLGNLGGGSGGWISPENLSISKVLTGLFPKLSRDDAVLLQYSSVGALVVSILIKQSGLIKRAGSNGPIQISELMRISLLFVLASPVVWYHHMVWLLLPFALALTSERSAFLRSSVIVGMIMTTSYRLVEGAFVPNTGWSHEQLLIEPALWIAYIVLLWMVSGRGASARSL